MTLDDVREQMKIASRLVETWPEWKRNILVQSAQPTVDVPRTPVDNLSKTSDSHDSQE
jgi:hypothetical protein